MTLILPALDEQAVQRELASLDPNLILTRERDAIGQDYYVVIYYQGGSIPPDEVIDWREPSGRAKPLSSALANEVRKMMRNGPPDVKAIIRANEEMKQRHAAQQEAIRLEQALEFEQSRKRSGAIHRSVGLRMARDRARARGEKV